MDRKMKDALINAFLTEEQTQQQIVEHSAELKEKKDGKSDKKTKCRNCGMYNHKTKDYRKPKAAIINHAERSNSAEECPICKEVHKWKDRTSKKSNTYF